MSSSLVRLRLQGMQAHSWRDTFAESVRHVDASIRVVDAVNQPGLGALDPSVIVAMITGGVQVLTAVITGLVACWVAARKERALESPTRVEIVLSGSRDTERLVVTSSSTVTDLEGRIAALVSDVGEIREISVSDVDQVGGGK